MAIAGSTQATFERIARALDRGELADDPRFADNQARMVHAEALDTELQRAVGERTLAELLEVFEAMEAPVGPVFDVAQILEHPQYRARENVVAVSDEELGRVRMQNVVPRLSDTPGRIEHAGPPKGRHNAEVYGELLGIGEDELAALHGDGVI